MEYSTRCESGDQAKKVGGGDGQSETFLEVRSSTCPPYQSREPSGESATAEPAARAWSSLTSPLGVTTELSVTYSGLSADQPTASVATAASWLGFDPSTPTVLTAPALAKIAVDPSGETAKRRTPGPATATGGAEPEADAFISRPSPAT